MMACAAEHTPYKPTHKVRFVTAASLFDGHDATINIMRRILQATGVEVIHLGHNRSVGEIVTAALQEDVQGVAITSYQGGHVEYFKYMIDLLRAGGGGDIRVFGGGGGVIVAEELDELHAYGVSRIYTPADGQRIGLQGMIDEVVRLADVAPAPLAAPDADTVLAGLRGGDRRLLARLITLLENGSCTAALRARLKEEGAACRVPVLGITGTGGAGKSSLTDELVRRFRLDQEDRLHLAIVSIDPSRQRTGGALLGDRIRMNAIDHPHIYMRSLATRDTGSEISAALPEVIAACRLAGFDLVIVETSGIGQGNAAIVPHVDLSLYVMTPEFGAASQLEKIDMLDFADFVAINKFDRSGAEDALRDVRKQYQRNHGAFGVAPEQMPVFPTVAARFNDEGVTALYQALLPRLEQAGLRVEPGRLARIGEARSGDHRAIVPAERSRYLAEIADCVHAYHRRVEDQVRLARERQALSLVRDLFAANRPGHGQRRGTARRARRWTGPAGPAPARPVARACGQLPRRRAGGAGARPGDPHPPHPHLALRLDRAQGGPAARRRPRRAAPLPLRENLPGLFPFTAGVFPFKRENEDPTRMFAGEGDPFRTNRRFKTVSAGMPAHRLSTAFDSPTLYGDDPDERPDIYGKIGNSGVSIATLDDMKELYAGFDLCAPTTSVCMTINGPAPIILAMFFNTAIDQQLDRFAADHGRPATEAEALEIRRQTFSTVRGTVQADILKEDQGQNTCIFSTEFALKMMGDIQEYFVREQVRNFYSVSISGYHIAEAGANPITPAGLHPGQRLHLRRVLPGPRHAHRRLRAQPVLLLLQRHGPRVHGDRPGGPAHLGRGHERQVRRQRALARSSSTTSRPRAGPCTPRRWPSTTSAPPCRRSSPSTTTATPCTPTPTTRPSPPPPRSRCAGPWPSS